jgi:hypothetical protein
MSGIENDDSGNLTFEKIDLELDDAALGVSEIDMDDLLDELDFGAESSPVVIDSGALLDIGEGDSAPTDALLGQLGRNHVPIQEQPQRESGLQPEEEERPELSSMEKLLTMDLIEVDEDKLRNELNEEIEISTRGQTSQQYSSQYYHQQEQTQYEQFTAPSRSSQMMETNNLSRPPPAVENLVNMGSDDLEREKIKLLRQLEEIKRKKQHNQLQQSHLQQRAVGMSSAFSNQVGVDDSGASSSGETPLQAFLRRSKGDADLESAPCASGVNSSILSRNVPDAPPVASILDVSPMDVGFGRSNPFLRQSRTSTMNGAMDMMGGPTPQNASWGADPRSIPTGMLGYRNSHSINHSSGLLPKHASEGVLMRAAGSSLSKSKHRQGSLSRENALYDLLRTKRGSKPNLTSLSRQGSQKSLSRQGSQKSLNREGSAGHLFPVKRGSAGSSKYRIGGVSASMSVPHMRMSPSYNRSTSPSYQGSQQNAMW